MTAPKRVELTTQIGDPEEMSKIVDYCLRHPLAIYCLMYRVLEVQQRQITSMKTAEELPDLFRNYLEIFDGLKKYLKTSTEASGMWRPDLMREIEKFLYGFYKEQIPVELRVAHQGLVLPGVRKH